MSSLHTKYRPTTFDGVVGQGSAVKSLKRVVKEGRTHTFLLTGPSGVGKTTLARIVANSLKATIIEVDAATNSGADDMRLVIDKTRFRAVGASPIKAIIVDECHRLSPAAWTIMLKPIEEPPEYVYWFLCTTEAGKVPKNILTRCLRYDLKAVDEVTIFELLLKVAESEKIKVQDEILEVVAEGAGGSPRQALVLLEACQHCKTADEASKVLRTAATAKEPVDLARLLIAKQGRSWQAALRIIKSMVEIYDAETIRIVLVNYLNGCILNSKTEAEALEFIRVLDCFSEPYITTDKYAPLFISVALALGLNR